MNDEDRRDRIRQEAANVHEAATYSSETQFEYAKHWRSVDRWVGSVAAGLAAVAGVGGLSKVLSFEWAGTIAILSALIGAVPHAQPPLPRRGTVTLAVQPVRLKSRAAGVFTGTGEGTRKVAARCPSDVLAAALGRQNSRTNDQDLTAVPGDQARDLLLHQ